MFEGVPNYPNAQPLLGSRRQAQGQHLLHRADRHPLAHGRRAKRRSRRRAAPRCALLGSVGEPINPEAWVWYHRVVGDGRCPIVDTWWQTETGGIMITPLPGAIGAQARLGDAAVLRRQAGDRRRRPARCCEAPARAICVIATLARPDRAPVYGDHERFIRPTSPPTPATTSPATAAGATPTATTGSPAASTT